MNITQRVINLDGIRAYDATTNVLSSDINTFGNIVTGETLTITGGSERYVDRGIIPGAYGAFDSFINRSHELAGTSHTSMYFGLNRIADVYPDVSTGGALWFPDLAAPDATMLLPLLAASTFFAMIEVGVDGQQLDANPQMKQMKNVMRALALVMVPATYNFPSAVFVYWCTQNLSLIHISEPTRLLSI